MTSLLYCVTFWFPEEDYLSAHYVVYVWAEQKDQAISLAERHPLTISMTKKYPESGNPEVNLVGWLNKHGDFVECPCCLEDPTQVPMGECDVRYEGLMLLDVLPLYAEELKTYRANKPPTVLFDIEDY